MVIRTSTLQLINVGLISFLSHRLKSNPKKAFSEEETFFSSLESSLQSKRVELPGQSSVAGKRVTIKKTVV